MHTFNAPGGTTFHVNSDGSGDAIVTGTVDVKGAFPGTTTVIQVNVPAADLLAFADWLENAQGTPCGKCEPCVCGHPRWCEELLVSKLRASLRGGK